MMKVNKNIAISENGFIFNAGRGDSYSVNPIGKEILEMIKEQKSQDDIKSYILDTYDVDEETIDKDLYDFITQLSNNNLIETNEQA